MMPTTLPAASRRTYRHPRVIVALDYPDEASALALAEQLNPLSCAVKVGNELFVAAGPFVVSALIERGFDVFLDLKFHDIPNTAAQACKAATRLGAWMMNVHASGGRAMLEAARAAVDQAAKEAGCERPLLSAVTVLTSLDDAALEDVGVAASATEHTLRLARLTQACGLDGIVCSANDTATLRRELGDDFVLVTPGIRPAGTAADDQARIATPEAAIRNGADYLVIGRPITQAKDPPTALAAIERSLEGAR